MPAPILADWTAVRDTAVALGSIANAADQHGVSRDAAYQRANREDWPVGRRPAKALAAAQAVLAEQVARTGGVKSVNTTQAIMAARAKIGENTKDSLAKYAERTALHAANVADSDPDVALSSAADVKAVAQTAALVHGWTEKAGQGSSVVNISVLGISPDCLDLSTDTQEPDCVELTPDQCTVEHDQTEQIPLDLLRHIKRLG